MVRSAFGCAACPAAQGWSCCEVNGEERLATLTAGDVARIQLATGLARQRFVGEEPFDPAAQAAYERIRPANRGAIRDGIRRHLLARDGACMFHRRDTGCTLDQATRPLLCQIYPFEVDDVGRLVAQPQGPCHAADSSGEMAQLLGALGTSRRKLLRLHRQLMEELDR